MKITEITAAWTDTYCIFNFHVRLKIPFHKSYGFDVPIENCNTIPHAKSAAATTRHEYVNLGNCTSTGTRLCACRTGGLFRKLAAILRNLNNWTCPLAKARFRRLCRKLISYTGCFYEVAQYWSLNKAIKWICALGFALRAIYGLWV